MVWIDLCFLSCSFHCAVDFVDGIVCLKDMEYFKPTLGSYFGGKKEKK